MAPYSEKEERKIFRRKGNILRLVFFEVSHLFFVSFKLLRLANPSGTHLPMATYLTPLPTLSYRAPYTKPPLLTRADWHCLEEIDS